MRSWRRPWALISCAHVLLRSSSALPLVLLRSSSALPLVLLRSSSEVLREDQDEDQVHHGQGGEHEGHAVLPFEEGEDHRVTCDARVGVAAPPRAASTGSDPTA